MITKDQIEAEIKRKETAAKQGQIILKEDGNTNISDAKRVI